MARLNAPIVRTASAIVKQQLHRHSDAFKKVKQSSMWIKPEEQFQTRQSVFTQSKNKNNSIIFQNFQKTNSESYGGDQASFAIQRKLKDQNSSLILDYNAKGQCSRRPVSSMATTNETHYWKRGNRDTLNNSSFSQGLINGKHIGIKERLQIKKGGRHSVLSKEKGKFSDLEDTIDHKQVLKEKINLNVGEGFDEGTREQDEFQRPLVDTKMGPSQIVSSQRQQMQEKNGDFNSPRPGKRPLRSSERSQDLLQIVNQSGRHHVESIDSYTLQNTQPNTVLRHIYNDNTIEKSERHKENLQQHFSDFVLEVEPNRRLHLTKVEQQSFRQPVPVEQVEFRNSGPTISQANRTTNINVPNTQLKPFARHRLSQMKTLTHKRKSREILKVSTQTNDGIIFEQRKLISDSPVFEKKNRKPQLIGENRNFSQSPQQSKSNKKYKNQNRFKAQGQSSLQTSPLRQSAICNSNLRTSLEEGKPLINPDLLRSNLVEIIQHQINEDKKQQKKQQRAKLVLETQIQKEKDMIKRKFENFGRKIKNKRGGTDLTVAEKKSLIKSLISGPLKNIFQNKNDNSEYPSNFWLRHESLEGSNWGWGQLRHKKMNSSQRAYQQSPSIDVPNDLANSIKKETNTSLTKKGIELALMVFQQYQNKLPPREVKDPQKKQAWIPLPFQNLAIPSFEEKIKNPFKVDINKNHFDYQNNVSRIDKKLKEIEQLVQERQRLDQSTRQSIVKKSSNEDEVVNQIEEVQNQINSEPSIDHLHSSYIDIKQQKYQNPQSKTIEEVIQAYKTPLPQKKLNQIDKGKSERTKLSPTLNEIKFDDTKSKIKSGRYAFNPLEKKQFKLTMKKQTDQSSTKKYIQPKRCQTSKLYSKEYALYERPQIENEKEFECLSIKALNKVQKMQDDHIYSEMMNQSLKKQSNHGSQSQLHPVPRDIDNNQHPFVASTLFDKRLSGTIQKSLRKDKQHSLKYIEYPMKMLVRD